MITELPKTRTETKEVLLEKYLYVRRLSEKICQPLQTEDYVVQPIVDVSPPKWHLGHTTWFFETFVLIEQGGMPPYHDNFSFIFNSYYETVGKRVIRANRGNLSRPTVEEVYNYRRHVDEKMIEFLQNVEDLRNELLYVLEVGIHHEQQHQELLITDIKYILGHNPIFPSYSDCPGLTKIREIANLDFVSVQGGIHEIGHDGNGFCYDNELGRHKVLIEDFEIANRVISNGEYLEFVQDGGYKDFNYWLSEGWDWVNNNSVSKPMYWHQVDDDWYEYTLKGFLPLNPDLPVTHISFFEADAFASWKGLRLPTEFEWEVACNQLQPVNENALYVESECFHPEFRKNDLQILGNVWEWTSSAYVAYPGFKKASGALGEYNGKFMVNQKVLRGGSIATPDRHLRRTYRNFFQPHLRWQFTGIRLAR